MNDQWDDLSWVREVFGLTRVSFIGRWDGTQRDLFMFLMGFNGEFPDALEVGLSMVNTME